MRVYVSIPKNTEVMRTFMPNEVLKELENNFEVLYCPFDRQLNAEEFCDAVAKCDAVITGWGHIGINYEMLKNTSVKLIAHTGGSVGSLVDNSVFNGGIRVISGNRIYAKSVAEGVIAYMLTGLRKIPNYVNRLKDGLWRREDDFSEGLLDKEVGIVGMGTISSYLMEMLLPFNVKIKVYSGHTVDDKYLAHYNAVCAPLDEVMACDIVTLHSALNEKTRGMIGENQLKCVRNGALFINTARGAIVDETALILELERNRFSAVLDVFCHEPLEKDSKLRSLPNVYCIPHMAGPTVDRRPFVTMGLIRNMKNFENGQDMELEINSSAAGRMTVGG